MLRPPSSLARNSGLSRRTFLKSTSLALGGLSLGAPYILRGNDVRRKLNIAVVGAAGKGEGDTDHCAEAGENIVALCDVNEKLCAGQLKKYPQAAFFRDYRKMLKEMRKSIDAVVIATPDHMHGAVATLAMGMGKHVYCQKPLTQTIYESRQLRDLARRKKVVTQMGNQGSAEDGLRRAVEVVQAGVLGPVRQVYVWSNRPIWPQGMDRPEGSDPVPATLDWDLWLGVAPERPYKNKVYEPFNWRGWLDFGCGALGDMACHTANMPFRALKLGYPTEVEAHSSGMNDESYPLDSTIRFEFPARDGMAATTFWWNDGGKPIQDPNGKKFHDGSNKPPREITAYVEEMRGEVPRSGCLLIGDHGQLFSPDDYGTTFFLKLNSDSGFQPGKSHPALRDIPESIPRNRFEGSADLRQKLEWLAAIKENKPALCYSNFDVSSKLTEIILLGCVALRVGQPIQWDGAKMKARNCPQAAQFIRRTNRKGFKLA